MQPSDQNVDQNVINSIICNGLRIGSWNINQVLIKCSDTIKTNDSDVYDIISEHDIFFISEAKLDPDLEDLVKIDGYESFYKSRNKKKNAKMYYGGIIVYIRKIYYDTKFITLVEDLSTSEMIWLKINFELGLTNHNTTDMFVGGVYVCPKKSTFNNIDDDGTGIYDELTTKIKELTELGNVICLGDFNSHTGNRDDFLRHDKIKGQEHLHDTNYVSDIVLPTRANQDEVSDQDGYGEKLLDLCKSTGLRLLNGRTLGDINGSLTFYPKQHNKRPSVIDYCAVSQDIIRDVVSFKVLRHIPDISDHSAISANILFPNPIELPTHDAPVSYTHLTLPTKA